VSANCVGLIGLLQVDQACDIVLHVADSSLTRFLSGYINEHRICFAAMFGWTPCGRTVRLCSSDQPARCGGERLACQILLVA